MTQILGDMLLQRQLSSPQLEHSIRVKNSQICKIRKRSLAHKKKHNYIKETFPVIGPRPTVLAVSFNY
jgi:hypothetical protein